MILELLLPLVFWVGPAANPHAVAEGTLSPQAPAPLEVFFEVKLLVRERRFGTNVSVDQWAGGRVLLEGTRMAGGAIDYRIAKVLEAPWTFRWYPAKNEAKLGAAIWVEHPEGHPYDALAPLAEEWVRERYALWWDRDESPGGGSHIGNRVREFWAGRHTNEQRDPLPEHPTYPFHVLGPIGHRFGFSLREGHVEDIVETMTEPWLADGWARAAAGEDVEGYGYWDSKRPRWEPRTYEAFATALRLLGPSSDEFASDPVVGLLGVLGALNPNAKRLGNYRAHTEDGGAMKPVWHSFARGRVEGAGADLLFSAWWLRKPDAKEVQVLVYDPTAEKDETFKAWVRVGFREVPARKP